MTLAEIPGAISPNPLQDLCNALAAIEAASKDSPAAADAVAWLTTAAHAVLAVSEPQPVVLTYEAPPNDLGIEELKRWARECKVPVMLAPRDKLAELRLDKPAMVGAVRFKTGVSWSVVIAAAQRRFELHA